MLNIKLKILIIFFKIFSIFRFSKINQKPNTMKKLKLGKLLVGSLTEAQQRNVLGGDNGASTTFYVNYVCVNAPAPPPSPSVNSPCTVSQSGCPSAPPPTKTIQSLPCA